MEPVTYFRNYPSLVWKKDANRPYIFFTILWSYLRTIVPFSTNGPIQHRSSHSAPEGMKSVPYDPLQLHMLVVRDCPIQHRPANFWTRFWHRNHPIRVVIAGWEERPLLSLSFRLWNERKKLTSRIWEPFLWFFGRCWMGQDDSAPVLNGTGRFSTSRPTVVFVIIYFGGPHFSMPLPGDSWTAGPVRHWQR